MKTKNITLGALATILAIGGAFASTLITPTHVKVGTSTCRQVTANDCGATGSLQCQVLINGITYPAYQDATCATQVTTTRTTPVEGQFVNP
jgi:hypothetical protein